VALGAVAAFASCAKQAPPSGGPVDETAPELVETMPGADRTQVPVTTTIRLLFSEKLDRRSFERGLAVNPRVRWAEQSWSGVEVTLVPVDSLLPDTTYVVTLGASIQDRRSNPVGAAQALGFSTGSRLDRGAMLGRVLRGEQGVARAGVWLYVWDDERVGDPEIDIPYRQTETDGQGTFSLPFVRPEERAYALFAYLDANRTGAFEEGDPWGFFPEPLTVAAPPETTGGIEVELWDSSRTGWMWGRVSGDWEAEGDLWLELTSPGDSTAARIQQMRRPGPFRLCGIPAGAYLLAAYQDLDGNGAWDTTADPREPRVDLSDTLEVSAGQALGNVEIRRVAGEEP